MHPEKGDYFSRSHSLHHIYMQKQRTSRAALSSAGRLARTLPWRCEDDYRWDHRKKKSLFHIAKKIIISSKNSLLGLLNNFFKRISAFNLSQRNFSNKESSLMPTKENIKILSIKWNKKWQKLLLIKIYIYKKMKSLINYK